MFWREVRRFRAFKVDVPEELRGWRWDSPPVAPPPLGVRLSVSDVVNRYCPTGRDLYL
ncbi:MAG: CRISPR-associated protein Cas4, partial [Thermoproteus sp.]|nr:CRISPR-associated protein Cas4 [Thermoproteus sp.]